MHPAITHSSNLAELVYRCAARHPARAAILGDSGAITYGELNTKMSEVARRLGDMGCLAGDRVIVAVSDPMACIASLFGAAAIGAVPVPVSPLQFAQEYNSYVKQVAPAITITDNGFSSVGGGNKDTESRQRIAPERRAPTEHFPLPVGEDDVAIIVHTSGSTGTQKAVAHSPKAVWAASENVTKVFGIGEEDRIFCLPRPYYSFGLGFGVLFPVFAGAGTIVGSPQLSLPEIGRLVAAHRPTILTAVPSALTALLKTAIPLDLSSIRFVISAGEALPVRVYDAFRERFGIEVLDGIGSTEMLTHFISNLPGQSRPGSCGVVLPGYDVLLKNDEGRPVPAGVVGSLAIQGHTSLLGYWSGSRLDRIAPKEAFPTGDKLYRDTDGYFYFCGRDDDMIKVGGAWVSPNEVQTILSSHPSVEKAFVTAYDGAGLARLVAYIVVTRGATITRGELVKQLSHMPTHTIPAFIVFLEELPLTNNGKVNRRALPHPHAARSVQEHCVY